MIGFSHEFGDDEERVGVAPLDNCLIYWLFNQEIYNGAYPDSYLRYFGIEVSENDWKIVEY